MDDYVYSIPDGADTTCNLLQQCITFCEDKQYSSCAEDRYLEKEDDDVDDDAADAADAADRRPVVSLRDENNVTTDLITVERCNGIVKLGAKQFLHRSASLIFDGYALGPLTQQDFPDSITVASSRYLVVGVSIMQREHNTGYIRDNNNWMHYNGRKKRR